MSLMSCLEPLTTEGTGRGIRRLATAPRPAARFQQRGGQADAGEAMREPCLESLDSMPRGASVRHTMTHCNMSMLRSPDRQVGLATRMARPALACGVSRQRTPPNHSTVDFPQAGCNMAFRLPLLSTTRAAWASSLPRKRRLPFADTTAPHATSPDRTRLCPDAGAGGRRVVRCRDHDGRDAHVRQQHDQSVHASAIPRPCNRTACRRRSMSTAGRSAAPRTSSRGPS